MAVLTTLHSKTTLVVSEAVAVALLITLTTEELAVLTLLSLVVTEASTLRQTFQVVTLETTLVLVAVEVLTTAEITMAVLAVQVS